MAFKTFTAGSAATASDIQTYLMNQVVIVCTSGTRPGSPVEGMVIYETDTDRLLFYDGATWNLPKNVAGGRVAGATHDATQTGITTVVDLTNLTVTFTALTARRFEIVGHVRLQSTVDGDYGLVQITDGANNELSAFQMKLGTSTQTMTPLAEVTPAAGSVTYKLRVSRSTGTGTLQTNHTATNPARITVRDIGGV